MRQFKTASRSLDELKTAKQELDEVFAIVRGPNGQVDKKAFKKLEDNRYEIAELVLQLINDTVLVTNPIPFLVDEVDGNLGTDYVWQEMDSTLRVVSRSYGTKPLSQRLVFKEYGMSTSHKEIAVEIPLEEIAVGRITASQVTDAMADAIIRYRIVNVLDGLDAGVTAGADHTGEAGYTLRYSGLTQANLDKAIDGLQDEAEAVTMFGRHIALGPAIRGFNGFTDGTTGWPDSAAEEFLRRGMIGSYHGCAIVTLRDQFHKREGGHLISKDRAYLASGTKGAKFMTKDVSFLDWAILDPRSSTFGVGTRLEDGLLVFDPYQYRIIEV